MPSLTTSAESPPGPSVIDVSTWIATVRRRRGRARSPSTRADEVGEAEGPQPLVELAGRVAGDAGRRCPAAGDRPATPRRSGRRGGARRTGSRRCSMRSSSSSSSWSLRGNTNHEPKNAGHEPRVAHDRAVGGLDEDAGVAERRGAHRSRDARQRRPGRRRRSGDGRVGVLLAGRGTRARSSRCRPSSAARSGPPGRRTSRPGTDGRRRGRGGLAAVGCCCERPEPRGGSRRRRSPPASAPVVVVVARRRRRAPSRPSRRRSSSAAERRATRPRRSWFAAATPSRPSRRPRTSPHRRRRRRRRPPRSVAAQVGDDVGAGGDDGDDVPAVGGLLGELGGQAAGLERGDADGVELVHGGVIVSREPPAPGRHHERLSARRGVGVGAGRRAVEDHRARRAGRSPRSAALTVVSSWVATTSVAPSAWARRNSSSSASLAGSVEADERLVDEQQLERPHEGEGDRRLLAQAAAERDRQVVGAVGEPERLEQVGGVAAPSRRCRAAGRCTRGAPTRDRSS